MTPTRESRYKERIKELELSIKNQAEFIANLKAQLNDGWLPISSAPKDGTELYGYKIIKYTPYKPNGAKQMGTKGRWQEATEYGWKNCDSEPEIYKPLPPAPKENE